MFCSLSPPTKVANFPQFPVDFLFADFVVLACHRPSDSGCNIPPGSSCPGKKCRSIHQSDIAVVVLHRCCTGCLTDTGRSRLHGLNQSIGETDSSSGSIRRTDHRGTSFKHQMVVPVLHKGVKVAFPGKWQMIFLKNIPQECVEFRFIMNLLDTT